MSGRVKAISFSDLAANDLWRKGKAPNQRFATLRDKYTLIQRDTTDMLRNPHPYSKEDLAVLTRNFNGFLLAIQESAPSYGKMQWDPRVGQSYHIVSTVELRSKLKHEAIPSETLSQDFSFSAYNASEDFIPHQDTLVMFVKQKRFGVPTTDFLNPLGERIKELHKGTGRLLLQVMRALNTASFNYERKPMEDQARNISEELSVIKSIADSVCYYGVTTYRKCWVLEPS